MPKKTKKTNKTPWTKIHIRKDVSSKTDKNLSSGPYQKDLRVYTPPDFSKNLPPKQKKLYEKVQKIWRSHRDNRFLYETLIERDAELIKHPLERNNNKKVKRHIQKKNEELNQDDKLKKDIETNIKTVDKPYKDQKSLESFEIKLLTKHETPDILSILSKNSNNEFDIGNNKYWDNWHNSDTGNCEEF